MQAYKQKTINKRKKRNQQSNIDMKTKKITKKEYIHNMVSQTAAKIEYTSTEAKVMAIMINEINNQHIVKRS